ncbi:hypothetical protein SAMN04488550_3239 [Gordonia malaquae]|uniref:O-acyltransferase WSD1 C-terminal domain-containing protein n=2 Tax=Gordonia malaquae TaxID=410332 RepID=M3VF13_GORML|nr:hypothetical protein GM1_011_01330 [Gordonia malaquae NBRC 108250]SED81747.1 hypothetical protein SAMN04488550_3239 [Gordonia malaquae]
MFSMAPTDAAMYWLGRGTVNDQFLLFAFDRGGVPDVVQKLRRRAAAIADLHLAVRTVPGDLDFPRWAPAPIRDDAIVVRPGDDWPACLAAVTALRPLRESSALWRVHVFDAVAGVPRVDGLGRVAVLQISHAVGDGRRVSAIARALFSREPAPFLRDKRVAIDDTRLAALRSGLLIGPNLLRSTALGLAAWAAEEPDGGRANVAPTRANVSPEGPRELRTLTVDAASLRVAGRSSTVGVLVGLAEVLPSFLNAPVCDASVELTVAFDDDRDSAARNCFQTVGVGLHADVRDRGLRASLIADEIAAARARVSSAQRAASRRAAESSPAVLVATAARLGSGAPPPASVAGWTVVSPVYRGAADLTLGGGAVRFTAGFPYLSSAHSLTHGVHRIGDTVTLSVNAGGRIADGVDDYIASLASVFAELAQIPTDGP